jgi:hypothetical protein
MSTYPVQVPPHAGSQITFVSPPANGDVVPCGTTIALMVVNPAANGDVTVSLPSPMVDQRVVAPRVVTVPQATSWLIPLPSSVYGSTVTLTYTGTLTTVQVAAVSFSE